MVTFTQEQAQDADAIEHLLDRVFGQARCQKTSYRFRDRVAPVAPLCYVAKDGDTVIGTLRYWPVEIGPKGTPALLLGPLAVDETYRGLGLGADLMDVTLAACAAHGHEIIVLVSDLAEFYSKFNFTAAAPTGITMPGEKTERIYIRGMVPNALAGVEGPVRPFGARFPKARSVKNRSAKRKAA
jgi:predicted N-acetyltransferase YhbS